VVGQPDAVPPAGIGQPRLFQEIGRRAAIVRPERELHESTLEGGGPASDDPDAPPQAAGTDTLWLQPFPDAAPGAEFGDPAEAAARTGLRLALVAALQYLPARQRAVLILRDVLAFSAAEVAHTLDMSVAAVKSALQRARTRLDGLA